MGMTMELGLTKEELREAIIERAVKQIMEDAGEYGDDIESRARDQMSEILRSEVDAAVIRVADAIIKPQIADMVEATTFQETNTWGEAKKPPQSWREYLESRVTNYLTEKVDYQGKSKKEGDSYSWKPAQTRVTHLVHQHLHYEIERQMKAAVAAANAAIGNGIEAAVKVKLQEIVAGLQVAVKTK